MSLARAILYIFLLLVLLPLGAIFCLSLRDNDGEPLKWYITVLRNEEYISALGLSLLVSAAVTVLALAGSMTLSLSWFNAKQRMIVLGIMILAGLLPPDILALCLIKLANLCGLYGSNPVLLVLCLAYYCLPYNIILLWSAYYYIGDPVIIAARDIGLAKTRLLVRVIVPLSLHAIISCLVLSFLLALNEFPRSYYLSGSYQLLSGFLNGKLTAGADPSIYAGGSISVLVILFFTGGLQAFYILRRRAQRFRNLRELNVL